MIIGKKIAIFYLLSGFADGLLLAGTQQVDFCLTRFRFQKPICFFKNSLIVGFPDFIDQAIPQFCY